MDKMKMLDALNGIETRHKRSSEAEVIELRRQLQRNEDLLEYIAMVNDIELPEGEQNAL